ncbi:MAG: hydroxyacylglutathione hydrolase [Spongiibacteraceae bacterium]
MIQIQAIPAFNDNYIWCLYDDTSKQAVVVDPGDAAPVQESLTALDLELVAILITHHHPDHTGGLNTLLHENKHGKPIPVYGPDSPKISQINHKLSEPESFSILGLTFNVIDIPGHTLDHIAMYCADSDLGPLLFCGDTLFAGGCGRIFEGNPAMMLASLSKLAELPANTRVYCAHEYTLSNLSFALAVEPNNPDLQQRFKTANELRQQQQATIPSLLQTELLTNPFLRCSEATVIKSAEHHSGKPCSTNTEVFATIRSWKDNF